MDDFILDQNNDISIATGDFVVGDSLIQEVGLICELVQGSLKSDLILGPNLFMKMKSIGNENSIRSAVKLHLARDKKDYEEIKEMIKVNVQNS